MKQHAALITVQRKDTFKPVSLTMTLSGSTLSSTLYHSKAVDFPMSAIVRLSSFLDYALGVSVVRHEADTWSISKGTFSPDVADMLEGMYRAALLNAIVE